MNIDLVIEGTGVFIDTPGAGKHITVSGSAAPCAMVEAGCWHLASDTHDLAAPAHRLVPRR